MSKEQMILTIAGLVITAIIIPLFVAEFRWRNRIKSELQTAREFREFIKTYLLKNAVLEFHSNPNPETDKVIEKITSGEPITEDEKKQLEDKLHSVAETSEDARKRLKAERTLELMAWVFEECSEALKDKAEARDRLFDE